MHGHKTICHFSNLLQKKKRLKKISEINSNKELGTTACSRHSIKKQNKRVNGPEVETEQKKGKIGLGRVDVMLHDLTQASLIFPLLSQYIAPFTVALCFTS